MLDVLLIDDEDGLRKVLTMTLEAAGLTVASARDGLEGIMLFRRMPARVVVADLYMPEMDGLEVLATLKREFRGVQIILMSGGGRFRQASPLAAAKHLGAIATIEKPFAMEVLVSAVRKALDDA